MPDDIHRQIVALVLKAAELARTAGIPNLLQPGLIREMIVAELLGHELIPSQRGADAHERGNSRKKYEYLSCKEGGTFQLDRMFRSPADKRAESLRRITRNSRNYFAVFYAAN